MRILGALVFMTGFILLLTIVLSGLGLFLMFLGFMLVVVGGGRRTVIINNVVSVNSTVPAELPYAGLKKSFFGFGGKKSRQQPVLQPPSRFALAAPAYDGELLTINSELYDKDKWRALVAYDPDIGRVANALAPYGQKYVDQLATAYLTLDDKEYLPLIAHKVLASAQEDAMHRRR